MKRLFVVIDFIKAQIQTCCKSKFKIFFPPIFMSENMSLVKRSGLFLF